MVQATTVDWMTQLVERTFVLVLIVILAWVSGSV